jgi:hypothetical protein
MPKVQTEIEPFDEGRKWNIVVTVTLTRDEQDLTMRKFATLDRESNTPERVAAELDGIASWIRTMCEGVD